MLWGGTCQVPTTAEEFESEDSEEDDEHPLTRDELHAKTMRGLAKRDAGTRKGGKASAASLPSGGGGKRR
jgi:hypothetical protein